MIYILQLVFVSWCFSSSHAALVFTTHTSNETLSIPAVDGLLWTDVVPVDMLPVIDVTDDATVFDFCDGSR